MEMFIGNVGVRAVATERVELARPDQADLPVRKQQIQQILNN